MGDSSSLTSSIDTALLGNSSGSEAGDSEEAGRAEAEKRLALCDDLLVKLVSQENRETTEKLKAEHKIERTKLEAMIKTGDRIQSQECKALYKKEQELMGKVECYLAENVSGQAYEVELQKMEAEDELSWSFPEWYEQKRFWKQVDKNCAE